MSSIAEKWARVTPQRTEDYEKGVNNPRTPWDVAAKAAEGNYESGVQAAITQKRFGKGVTKAGASKWLQGAINKGTARFGPGVQVAQPDFEKGFAPFRQVIESTTLPQRFAKGDARNVERVRVMAKALADAKRK